MIEIIQGLIYEQIKNKSLSEKDLSERSKVCLETIEQIRDKTCKDVGIVVLLRICKALNIAPGMIINQLPDMELT